MKFLISISLFFFISNLFSQEFSQEIKNEFSNKFCECLNNSKEVNQSSISNCSQVELTNYEQEIAKFYDKNSTDSEYEQGYRIGQLLMKEMQEIFITDCDVYYLFWENLKEKSISDNKEKYKDFDLIELNNKINNLNSSDLLWERGVYYFHMNKLDKAESDFNQALFLNPKHYQSIFFIAWVHEKKVITRRLLNYLKN